MLDFKVDLTEVLYNHSASAASDRAGQGGTFQYYLSL